MTMIKPLASGELENLSLEELVSRMDSVFKVYGEELYGNDFSRKFRPKISRVISAKHVQRMAVDKQRFVCHLTFKCLLQMEYTNFTYAAMNHYVYGSGYDEDQSWHSPLLQIRFAALKQFGIVSSRISMECFMNLLYFLGTGEKLKAEKSTFKKFKKWLQNVENPFSYFATHILRAFIFDREYRTPEVHASSKLSNDVLRMKKPPEEKSSYMELANVMLNIWGPLVEILNDRKASSMQGSKEDFKWLKSYLNDDLDTKSENLKQIFEQMK